MIRLKSIYADPEPDDGKRILVMRRWPRGVRKDRVDEWMRDLGPTQELLRAYRLKKVGPAEFFEKYRQEMADRQDLLKVMAARAQKETLTLLCWEERNEDCHRYVLKELIETIGKQGSAKTLSL